MYSSGALAASAAMGHAPPQMLDRPKRTGFAYNERVALALVPTLLWLGIQGGPTMASILAVRARGAMCWGLLSGFYLQLTVACKYCA